VKPRGTGGLPANVQRSMNRPRFLAAVLTPLLALGALAGCDASDDTEAFGFDTAALDLVVDHGCGFGFATSSADQTAGLSLFWTKGFDPSTPRPFGVDDTGSVALPSGGWDGEFWIGTDLFANWCDDVVEVDEPVPSIVERWTLVSGVLTFDEPDGLVEFATAPVTATLSGVTIESAGGEQRELADINLTNPAWGFFAG
jgi:hypothetical protein